MSLVIGVIRCCYWCFRCYYKQKHSPGVRKHRQKVPKMFSDDKRLPCTKLQELKTEASPNVLWDKKGIFYRCKKGSGIFAASA